MPQTTTCLYSTVVNTNAAEKTYSFLPPHGRTLAINGTLTMAGHPVDAIRRQTRYSSKAHLDAFEAALSSGDLEIRDTPNPVLYDETNVESKMLTLDGGALFSADPCWLTGSSSTSLSV
jgi:hypothetical protein